MGSHTRFLVSMLISLPVLVALGCSSSSEDGEGSCSHTTDASSTLPGPCTIEYGLEETLMVITYEYDSDNRVKTHTRQDVDASSPSLVETFEYDSSGNVIGIEREEQGGRRTSTHTFEYFFGDGVIIEGIDVGNLGGSFAISYSGGFFDLDFYPSGGEDFDEINVMRMDADGNTIEKWALHEPDDIDPGLISHEENIDIDNIGGCDCADLLYEYEYDSSGRLIREDNARLGDSVSYTYDGDSERIVEAIDVNPHGQSFTEAYTYDEHGNLQTVDGCRYRYFYDCW